MLFALLAIGFFTLGTISPILGQGSRKFDVVFEGKGFKGEVIRVTDNNYVFVVNAYNVLCLEAAAPFVKKGLYLRADSAMGPGEEKIIDQNFTLCGFKHSRDDAVNYLVIKSESQYPFKCHGIINDSYDAMMAAIEEAKKDALTQE